MAAEDALERNQLLKGIHELRATDGVDALPPSVSAIIDVAERLATEQTFGSCERGRPFAEMFLVARADGKMVWRCAHDPAHEDREA